PVRAGTAPTPEASAFTSISQRIRMLKLQTKVRSKHRHSGRTQSGPAACPLMPFVDDNRSASAIPFGVKEYLSLVDWSGRALHPGKAGAVQADLPSILHRLGIRPSAFAEHMSGGGRQFARA